MKKTLCTVLCLLLLIAVFLGGVLHGFEEVALNPTKYDRLQKELDVYEYAGMDEDALSRVNRLLADYLTGKADSLSIEEEVFGIRRQVFNENEQLHMIDVLNLFHLAHGLKIGLLIAGSVLFAAFLIAARPNVVSTLIRALVWFVRGAGVLLLAGIVLAWAVGFDRLFILFHNLLFSNDLWLMNPATDIMVRIFPSEFFRQIALDALFSALTVGICATGAVLWICGILFRSTFGRKQTS